MTGLGPDSPTFYRRLYPLGAQKQLSHLCSPWQKSQKILNLQKINGQNVSNHILERVKERKHTVDNK